ncbi:uncharacterized protein OCT59_027798 [Rhizophagus irregularis]|uniref:Uncharacterized protein n=1 Tax=Rhizophagus irregularis (strain DAOM 181602 / DAOM 197198 / MUCL 43194) TaxID=747089 RepID=A0A2P4QW03_RHIID|nr:hypothetical protein GLOIN_2v1762732 [Rhizophagus irregularis DAOM 181602=DAOM 197198]POG81854.1 hypothetical protein GLOIN_2v1762732 [Rhizophagus irregularis DAOM 181602=DAOM 197198]UZO07514.1 hypothetical protein OCT59_027798 [Rhizophagus irregularis]GBC15639.2 hypothetical protein GLOIN_2v1762732 [Rhizophagus irregularis DAOM 181602=DAOM 197198]|eukprot:XP_025188720.1 hypothetical protein GLOIN_2v1762732 [Rhizophagus irregularis DAOM 181602=DAOM 197198]
MSDCITKALLKESATITSVTSLGPVKTPESMTFSPVKAEFVQNLKEEIIKDIKQEMAQSSESTSQFNVSSSSINVDKKYNRLNETRNPKSKN